MNKFVFIYLIALNFLFAGSVLAVPEVETENGNADLTEATCEQGMTCLCDPLTGYCAGDNAKDAPNMNTMIGTIINGALGAVGSLALAAFVYGGFVMMISAGNMERVQKGRSILIYASIGLIIIFSAYAIVKFVLDGVTGA